MKRSTVMGVAGVALAAAAAGWGTGVATAQEDEATIRVDQIHPAGEGVHYFVVVEDGDGEPVDGATVTVTPTSPSGDEGPAVTLAESGGGVYQGAIGTPEDGTWTVTFTSTDPDATLEQTQEVPVSGEEFTGVETESDDEGSDATIVLIAAAVFVLLLVAMVVWAVLGRRRDEAAAAASADDADTTPAEQPDDDTTPAPPPA